MARTKGKMKTRTLAILIGIGVVVVGGGVAFAFFSNVGAGSGTAGTGTNVAVAVVQTSTVTAMAPGLAPQALSGNFNNPNQGATFIKSVTATVTAVAGASPAPSIPAGAPTTCTPSDFAIGTGTTIGSGQTATGTVGLAPASLTAAGVEIPAGTAQGAWGGLNVAIINKPTNQDACKGSTVTITYVANAN
jgi:hypothetical protein